MENGIKKAEIILFLLLSMLSKIIKNKKAHLAMGLGLKKSHK
jgi:hypothetical protein